MLEIRILLTRTISLENFVGRLRVNVDTEEESVSFANRASSVFEAQYLASRRIFEPIECLAFLQIVFRDEEIFVIRLARTRGVKWADISKGKPLMRSQQPPAPGFRPCVSV